MVDRIGNDKVSPIGIGTWGIGGGSFPDSSHDERDLRAIKFAIENGLTLIDTAEMYARGHSEEIVGRAIKDFDRNDLFITTKVWNNHLHHDDVIKSAKASLKRLDSKYIDLYLIHWPSTSVDIRETIGAMESLVEQGITRYIGVSNFSVQQTREAMESASKYDIAANEIEYSLSRKEPEKDVIPFCENNDIAVIAYTPINKGRAKKVREILSVSEKTGKTPIQVALSYLKRRSIPIPKSTNHDHIREIAGALNFEISDQDYEKLRQS